MDIQPAPLDVVIETQILKEDFEYAYSIFGDEEFQKLNDSAWRATSNIHFPFLNVVYGEVDDLQAQIDYFAQKKLPFAWYLDQDASESFKQKLKERDFKPIGTFQGMIGPLNPERVQMPLPDGYEFGIVEDEKEMSEFTHVLCTLFQMPEADKLNSILWKHNASAMYNLYIKKDGQIISTLSIYIDKDIASFWNGGTHPDHRGKGLMTLLGQRAEKLALEQKCQRGATYLMADAMALGICNKNGAHRSWAFDVYLPQ